MSTSPDGWRWIAGFSLICLPTVTWEVTWTCPPVRLLESSSQGSPGFVADALIRFGIHALRSDADTSTVRQRTTHRSVWRSWVLFPVDEKRSGCRSVDSGGGVQAPAIIS